MSTKGPAASQGRRPASRLLRGLDLVTSTSSFALAVVVLDLLWVGFSLRFSFPARLERIFQTLVAAITLAMVFVIQHTQARQQDATQRKLDEILSALPDADNSLISLESASDHELEAVTRKHRSAREEAHPEG